MRPFFIFCFAFGLTFSSLAFGEDELKQKPPCAPAQLAGVNVVCFSDGIGAFSAKERAAAVEARLNDLAKDPGLDPGTLSLVEASDKTDIVDKTHTIVSIFDTDVDSTLASNRTEMGAIVLKRTQAAIDADRALKSPGKLLESLAYTVTITAFLILCLVGLSRIYPRIYQWIERSKGHYIKSVRIQTFELLNSARIVAGILSIARGSRIILTLFLLYIYVPLVLSLFPWTSNWTPTLLSYILTPLKTIATVIIDYIPKLFFIIAIVIFTRYLMKFIHFLFLEIESGNLQLQGFYREWASPTYKLVRVLILAFAFVMTFPYLPGSSSPAFQGISVFLGLLLSLGSSSAIANIVAGVVITYMRPFRLGDRVKIADTVGDVIEKNLLVTRIRSIKNVDITVPNSMVLGSHIINYSSTAESEGLILTTTVTLGYDVPWRKVHELLIAAAHRTEFVMTGKSAFVLQTALNDFAVAYELNAFTDLPNRMALIYSILHQNIQDCFNEAGIEIMSPHYNSIRDGNETTLPPDYRPNDYVKPGFSVATDLPT